MATRMQQRRGTAAQWAAANPVLADGEAGYEKDTKIFKVGDGVSTWNQLPSILSGLYLPLNSKAADADKLDGMDSSTFAQKNYIDALATPAGSSRTLVNHFGSVTTFPTSNVLVGDRCRRTDLFCEMYWNGTAWRQVAPAELTSAQRIVLTANATAKASLYVGFRMFETDTLFERVWDGKYWEIVKYHGDRAGTGNADSAVGPGIAMGTMPGYAVFWNNAQIPHNADTLYSGWTKAHPPATTFANAGEATAPNGAALTGAPALFTYVNTSGKAFQCNAKGKIRVSCVSWGDCSYPGRSSITVLVNGASVGVIADLPETRHRVSGYAGSGYLDQPQVWETPVLPGDVIGMKVFQYNSGGVTCSYFNALQAIYI